MGVRAQLLAAMFMLLGIKSSGLRAPILATGWSRRALATQRQALLRGVPGEKVVLSGAVERVTFRSEGGYTIARMRLADPADASVLATPEPLPPPDGRKLRKKPGAATAAAASVQLVTIVAKTCLATVVQGDWVSCCGVWVEDKKYGLQVSVESSVLASPAPLDLGGGGGGGGAAATEAGARAWLLSGALPGIGPKIAERILAIYGDRTHEVVPPPRFALLGPTRRAALRVRNVRPHPRRPPAPSCIRCSWPGVQSPRRRRL
jgi:hypothetical protein